MNKKNILLFVLLFGLFGAIGCTKKDVNEINVIYPAFHAKYMTKAAINFEKKTGYKVNIHYFNYDEQFAEIMKSLEAKEPIYDVFSLDLIWTSEFASKGYVADLTDKIRPLSDDISPALVDAFVYQNKIYGMPFLLDYQIFFYNKEYIKKAGFSGPPNTLEEMVEQMEVMKKKGIVEYPWYDSWNQNEALICEYAWLTAAFGGETFDENGKAIFNEGAGLEALKFMKMLLDKGLASPTSLHSIEYMARKSFIKGRCAFNTNWENQHTEMMDPTMSEVIETGEMGLIPVSEKVLGKYDNDTVSVSGFEGLAILSNSKVKDAAWEYIQYISSPEVQPEGFDMMPIWTSIQNSPDMMKKDPLLNLKSRQIAAVHHRPKVPKYTEISAIMQRYIHKALKGELEPKEALDKAVVEINLIKH